MRNSVATSPAKRGDKRLRSGKKRNQYLTPAMERCLVQIRDGEHQELIYSGGEVWVDDTRYAPATLNRLLRYCLLRNSSHGEVGSGYEIYELNEDGRGVISDPNYVPAIIRPETLREVRRQQRYHERVMRNQ